MAHKGHTSGKKLMGDNQISKATPMMKITDKGGNPQKTGHLKPSTLVNHAKPLR